MKDRIPPTSNFNLYFFLEGLGFRARRRQVSTLGLGFFIGLWGLARRRISSGLWGFRLLHVSYGLRGPPGLRGLVEDSKLGSAVTPCFQKVYTFLRLVVI